MSISYMSNWFIKLTLGVNFMNLLFGPIGTYFTPSKFFFVNYGWHRINQIDSRFDQTECCFSPGIVVAWTVQIHFRRTGCLKTSLSDANVIITYQKLLAQLALVTVWTLNLFPVGLSSTKTQFYNIFKPLFLSKVHSEITWPLAPPSSNSLKKWDDMHWRI
jgi:hypothetical protein